MNDYLLETPHTKTSTAVLFVPGISGGALTERFNPLRDAVLSTGFAIARVNIWENTPQLEQMTLGEIRKRLREIISELEMQGFERMMAVGKSFGGAALLTLSSPHIQKQVLWAPALGYSDTDSNIESYLNTPLGTIATLLDIHINSAYLKTIPIPTCIIHGTADTNIPFANSEGIIASLPQGKLVSIESADHSFRDPVHERLLLSATLEFLTMTWTPKIEHQSCMLLG
jgi:dienelactone hydrolase